MKKATKRILFVLFMLVVFFSTYYIVKKNGPTQPDQAGRQVYMH